MPRIPSKTILARDVIGQAIELVSLEDARKLITSLRIQYYNLAINEIYINLLSLIDVESTIQYAEGIWDSGHFDRDFTLNLSTNANFDSYDSIVDIQIYDNLIIPNFFDVERLPLQEFLAHKKHRKAMPPYDEMFIYTEYRNKIEIMHGENVDALSDPKIGIYFKKQPTLLTTSNFTTLYMELPDKYLPLLVARIASYAELAVGVTEKAFAMVKMSYEQLLGSVEPALRTKIMGTLQPKGEE